MNPTAQKIYYSLSAFLLLTAVFILSPSRVSEMAALQDRMTEQMSVAWQQTIGDQPYFDSLDLVFDSIHQFYVQTADATVALLEHGEGDHDLALIFQQSLGHLAHAIDHLPQPVATVASKAGPNFMSEPPIYNIIPERSHVTGVVSGAVEEPVNPGAAWVTMRDNFTQQLYCVALYNGELNKYLGPCKYDYR